MFSQVFHKMEWWKVLYLKYLIDFILHEMEEDCF